MIKIVSAAVAAAVLVACAPQIKQVWIRTDGQSIPSSVAYEQALEIDKTICLGEVQKANVQGPAGYCGGAVGCAVAANIRSDNLTDVGKGCMAQRGYLMVPEDQAEERKTALRAAAAANPNTTAKPVLAKRSGQ